MYKRYEWDAWYVQYAGFWLDIKIIAGTAWQTALALVGKKKRKRPAQIRAISYMLQAASQKPKAESPNA
jgi:putative colanic acid biosynthesis UDP-glucose lipid carrier transferase